MSRKRTFSFSDLTRVCAQVKRHIINEVKKGRLTSHSKTYFLDKVSEQLGLKSARVLQDTNFPFRDYLHTKFLEIKGQAIETVDIVDKKVTTHELAEANDILRRELSYQKQINVALKQRVDFITMELQEYYSRLPKYSKIDSYLEEIVVTKGDSDNDFVRPRDKE